LRRLKEGSYIERELKLALRYAKSKKIPIFPIMIKECSIPEELEAYQISPFAKRKASAAQREFVRSVKRRLVDLE
jgi:hypothetical protein